ncbi:MAG TPA: YciI family protein, partial [Saprospiraceae bacterium]|nr:YciI family protein [Saprospiraceae bacterium]
FAWSACQSPKPAPQPAPADLLTEIRNAAANGFDSSFARQMGADEYGMKPYVMAFLKRGPNRTQDSVTAAQLQKAHLDNIGRMAEAGQLVVAGPFMDDGDVRGIYIFNVGTVEEARRLTETDPAIQAGRLTMELHPWYGSAALPLLLPLHKKLEKNSVAD